MLHFVYPYKKSVYNELKYSLRSIVKNVKCDYDITIIGERPDWLDISKVRFIYYSQCDSDKQKNILHIADIACNIFDEFIWIHDDMIILKPINETFFNDIYYLEDFNKIEKWGKRKFQRIMYENYKLIKEKGYYGLNYITHIPVLYKSHILRHVIYDVFDLFSRRMVAIENFYFNYIHAEKFARKIDNIKYGIYDNSSIDYDKLKSATILNFDEMGISTGILNWLKKEFNSKSEFEL